MLPLITSEGIKCICTLALIVVLLLTDVITFASVTHGSAVPEPAPTPVAVNIVPTLLFAAPISVKFVVPVTFILYLVPTINAPALILELEC